MTEVRQVVERAKAKMKKALERLRFASVFFRPANLFYGFGFAVSLLYGVSMLVVPVVGNEWTETLRVWDRWQTFNAAMIALFSSTLAFGISRVNEERRRRRRFAAARAFLPHALSELSRYAERSSSLLGDIYRELKLGSLEAKSIVTPPAGYQSVIRDCIQEADEDVGDALALLVARLQVHEARLQELVDEVNGKPGGSLYAANVMVYIYCVAQIHVLIGRLFPVAREGARLNRDPGSWDNFRSAYLMNGIDYTEVDGLEDFSQRNSSRLWDRY